MDLELQQGIYFTQIYSIVFIDIPFEHNFHLGELHAMHLQVEILLH